MHEVHETGSYVRKRHANVGRRDETTDRIWGLLATPQTVESLCRALDDSDDDCRARVTEVLTDLYDKELIELSPDA